MKLLILLAANLFVVLSAAHAGKGHTHGEGTLDATLDKDMLTLDLELPLDASVGFERPPKNAKEKDVLNAADKLLKDPTALFLPTPAAQCTPQSAKVQVPFTGGDDPHAQHQHEGEAHHADINARYVFRCANAAALKSVETTLFKHFKRLYRLEVRRVGPSGQGAQRLTPKAPVLSW
ncbi:hypothetical protein MASR1M60_25010 [Rhodocyclaceae bacterium]